MYLYFQEKFLPFLDMFQKESVRVEVCKCIMESFIKWVDNIEIKCTLEGLGECIERLLGKMSQYIGHLACEGVPGYGGKNRKCVNFVNLLIDCLTVHKESWNWSNHIDADLLWIYRIVVLWAFLNLYCLGWFMKFISYSSWCDSTELLPWYNGGRETVSWYKLHYVEKWVFPQLKMNLEDEASSSNTVKVKQSFSFQIINRFLQTFFFLFHLPFR